MPYGVGDEVVCINDNEPPQGQGPNVVVKGKHYTITGMEARPYPVIKSHNMIIYEMMVFVFVKEVPSPRGVGFFAFRFAKAEKKSGKTDISIFKEIADGTRTVPLDPIKPKVPEKV